MKKMYEVEPDPTVWLLTTGSKKIKFESIEHLYHNLYREWDHNRVPGKLILMNGQTVGEFFIDRNHKRVLKTNWGIFGQYTVTYVLVDSSFQVIDIEKVWADFKKWYKEKQDKLREEYWACWEFHWSLKQPKNFRRGKEQRKSYKGGCRDPKTTNEQRQWFDAIDQLEEFKHESKLPRAKRNAKNLIDSYDDLPVCYQKTWKAFRKKQWKEE